MVKETTEETPQRRGLVKAGWFRLVPKKGKKGLVPSEKVLITITVDPDDGRVLNDDRTVIFRIARYGGITTSKLMEKYDWELVEMTNYKFGFTQYTLDEKR